MGLYPAHDPEVVGMLLSLSNSANRGGPREEEILTFDAPGRSWAYAMWEMSDWFAQNRPARGLLPIILIKYRT